MTRQMRDLIEKQRILVCCGAGGVGKTTVSAALAVAAARAGRRVLVLTIDPSKRLAQTLGVGRNNPEPTMLSRERQRAIGIEEPGCLSAWMIDPKLIADNAVRQIIKDPREAERFLKNKIYLAVTDMIAGMQEYTAMEALHELVESQRYDLVVLDTPPSRNALNFLEGPEKLNTFLDGSVFKLFIPKDGSMVMRVASRVIHPVMRAVFGEELFNELQVAFGTFGSIFRILNGNAQNMREYLSQPSVSFFLITSPFDEAASEARFFRQRIRQLGLPFRGMILNRSYALSQDVVFPDARLLSGALREALKSAFIKLEAMALREKERSEADQALLARLAKEAGEGAFALPLPELHESVDDLESLRSIADMLVAEEGLQAA